MWSSFVKEVLKFAMLPNLKLPVIEPYYRKTDPKEHVGTFVISMYLYGS